MHFSIVLGLGSREQPETGKPSLLKKLAAKHIVQISCGGNHCLSLTKSKPFLKLNLCCYFNINCNLLDGELYAWGSNAFGQVCFVLLSFPLVKSNCFFS